MASTVCYELTDDIRASLRHFIAQRVWNASVLAVCTPMTARWLSAQCPSAVTWWKPI